MIKLKDLLNFKREVSVGSREPPRKMSPEQIHRRHEIGTAMLNNPSTVEQFKKKHGDIWVHHLWALATNKAMEDE